MQGKRRRRRAGQVEHPCSWAHRLRKTCSPRRWRRSSTSPLPSPTHPLTEAGTSARTWRTSSSSSCRTDHDVERAQRASSTSTRSTISSRKSATRASPATSGEGVQQAPAQDHRGHHRHAPPRCAQAPAAGFCRSTPPTPLHLRRRLRRLDHHPAAHRRTARLRADIKSKKEFKLGDVLSQSSPTDAQFGLIPSSSAPADRGHAPRADRGRADRHPTKPKTSLVKQYRSSSRWRVKLKFTRGALTAVARQALDRAQRRARSAAILEAAMLDIMLRRAVAHRHQGSGGQRGRLLKHEPPLNATPRKQSSLEEGYRLQATGYRLGRTPAADSCQPAPPDAERLRFRLRSL